MIYRLVYVSRSALEGDAAQVDAALAVILATSRRNNADAGVSGALLFSAGWFAQVLEGEWDGVQATFERIQCDPRHLDTVVLQAGPAAERAFAGWAMAYTGQRTTRVRCSPRWAGRRAGPARARSRSWPSCGTWCCGRKRCDQTLALVR